MPDWEDLYQVLEVSPEAGPDEIRHAYSAKVMAFHPDRLFGVADELKRVAEEKLKAVNEAYEILRDADKRAEFHDDWLSRNSPPRPEVDPPVLRFDDVAAGRTMTGHFVIRNSGGPYDSIHVSNPESWVNISGYSSLSEDDELPLRIDVEVRPDQWGKSYAETISVGLDDQEIQVPVELYTRAVPRSGRALETTTFRTGPAPPLTSTARRGPAPDLDTHQPGHPPVLRVRGAGQRFELGSHRGSGCDGACRRSRRPFDGRASARQGHDDSRIRAGGGARRSHRRRAARRRDGPGGRNSAGLDQEGRREVTGNGR